MKSKYEDGGKQEKETYYEKNKHAILKARKEYYYKNRQRILEYNKKHKLKYMEIMRKQRVEFQRSNFHIRYFPEGISPFDPHKEGLYKGSPNQVNQVNQVNQENQEKKDDTQNLNNT